MSHVTTIEIEESYGIQALKRMCLDKGWIFASNQNSFKSYQSGQLCHHVIKIPGAEYEVGVVPFGNKWKLKWDSYHRGGLQTVLGKNAGVLKQAYGMAKTKVTAAMHRKRCYQRPAQQAGWTRLVVEV